MTELRCTDVEARFVDSVDGRLAPADSVRFHAHIEGCASCRARAALWRGLVPALREAALPEPDAMATRRMQLNVERQLRGGIAEAPASRPRRWWVPALGLAVASAAGLVLWWRAPQHQPRQPGEVRAAVGYAALAAMNGPVTMGAQALAVGARVAEGAPLSVGDGASVELALDQGATVRIAGPARVRLLGNAGNVAIHLDSGRVDAEVTHRAPDQLFAVLAADLRVVVRGTRFVVATTSSGARVEVREGRVAVERAGRVAALVSAGETFDSAAPEAALPAAPAPVLETSGRGEAVGCAEATRACRVTARAVRASMRADEPQRALRLMGDARRARTVAPERCDAEARACDDELRYLNAEALNQAGRVDEAVAAYHALDHHRAPPAMRQNALFAAGQLQKRRGRVAAAGADFERALAVAPRGALREEALAGAMESARDAGEPARARAFAARYLREYPRGVAAAAARRLTGDGGSP